MRCTTFREALSARLDGEEVGLAVHELDAHLAGCVDCQAWSRSAGVLAQIAAGAPRDHAALDPAVLASLTSPASESRTGLLATSEWRIVLALIAVAQLVMAWPGAFLHDGHASAHLAHELTAWDVGLAVGFLVAALRPARAWGMLPLAVVLVACLVAISVADILSGHALLGRGLVHVFERAGLGAVWVLARRIPRPSVVVRFA